MGFIVVGFIVGALVGLAVVGFDVVGDLLGLADGLEVGV